MAKGKRNRGSRDRASGNGRDQVHPDEALDEDVADVLSAAAANERKIAPVSHEPFEVLLNGGEPIMNNGSIGVMFYFNEALKAKDPRFVLVQDCDTGERKIFDQKDAVNFIMFHRAGDHELRFVAYATEDGEGLSDYWLGERDGRWKNSFDWSELTGGNFRCNFKPLATTAVKVSVPKVLFATRPEGRWGKFAWWWSNWGCDKKPRDECEYRKRKLFAFWPIPPIKPVYGLGYLIVKHLVVGVASALYVMLMSSLSLFFGVRPRPILRSMWEAFLCIGEPTRPVSRYRTPGKGWGSDGGDLYKWFKRYRLWGFRDEEETKPIYLWLTPFEVSLLVGCPWSICWILSTISEVEDNGLLKFLLIAAFIAVLVCILVLWSRFRITERIFPRLKELRKAQEAHEQQLAQARLERAAQVRREAYRAWLSQFDVTRRPEKIDLGKVPDGFERNPTVHRLRIKFWAKKMEVCRPFEE